MLHILNRRPQVTPPEIGCLTRIKRNPVELPISLLSGERIRIITQHRNDPTVLTVILLMIEICLIRNVDPDTVSFREALHYWMR